MYSDEAITKQPCSNLWAALKDSSCLERLLRRPGPGSLLHPKPRDHMVLRTCRDPFRTSALVREGHCQGDPMMTTASTQMPLNGKLKHHKSQLKPSQQVEEEIRKAQGEMGEEER